jgi:hypothetical protein
MILLQHTAHSLQRNHNGAVRFCIPYLHITNGKRGAVEQPQPPCLFHRISQSTSRPSAQTGKKRAKKGKRGIIKYGVPETPFLRITNGKRGVVEQSQLPCLFRRLSQSTSRPPAQTKKKRAKEGKRGIIKYGVPKTPQNSFIVVSSFPYSASSSVQVYSFLPH